MKHSLLKLRASLAMSKKKQNLVTMIQIVSKKNSGSLMNYKELIYLQWIKGTGMHNLKKGCYINGKKDLQESLRWKISLRKICSLFCQEYNK